MVTGAAYNYIESIINYSTIIVRGLLRTIMIVHDHQHGYAKRRFLFPQQPSRAAPSWSSVGRAPRVKPIGESVSMVRGLFIPPAIGTPGSDAAGIRDRKDDAAAQASIEELCTSLDATVASSNTEVLQALRASITDDTSWEDARQIVLRTSSDILGIGLSIGSTAKAELDKARESLRTKLKAQATDYDIKLKNARSAGKVKVDHAKSEFEAHSRATIVTALGGNDGSAGLLAKAYARQSELSSAGEELKDTINELEARLIRQAEANETMNERLADALKQQGLKEKEAKRFGAELTASRAECAARGVAVTTLRKALDAMESMHTDLRSTIKAQLLWLRGRLAFLKEELTLSRRTNLHLNKQLDVAKNALLQTGKLKAVDAMADLLLTSLREADEQVDDLDKARRQLGWDLELETTALDRERQQLEQIADELSALKKVREDEAKNGYATANAVRAELDKTRDFLAAACKELENSRKELTEARAEVKTGQATLKACQDELSVTKKEVTMANGRSQYLETTAKESLQRVSKLQKVIMLETAKSQAEREKAASESDAKDAEMKRLKNEFSAIIAQKESDARSKEVSFEQERQIAREAALTAARNIRILRDELATTKGHLEDALNSMHLNPDERLGAMSKAIASANYATVQMQKVQEASKQEREVLVKSTLHSLGQLRDHLTVSLSGLKTANQRTQGGDERPSNEEDLVSRLQFRRSRSTGRWGVVSETGDLNTMVVKLEATQPSPLAAPVTLHDKREAKGTSLPSLVTSKSEPLLKGRPPRRRGHSQATRMRTGMQPGPAATPASSEDLCTWSQRGTLTPGGPAFPT